jgi:hypothetical protein
MVYDITMQMRKVSCQHKRNEELESMKSVVNSLLSFSNYSCLSLSNRYGIGLF